MVARKASEGKAEPGTSGKRVFPKANLTREPDRYYVDGCGRCQHFATPQCKVRAWSTELALLRDIALSSGLEEEMKWGHPCYTHRGKNIALVHCFKEYVAVLFFKGALLNDPGGLLVQQTENVQSARQLRFTRLSEVKKARRAMKAFINRSVELSEAGVEVEKKKTEDFAVPSELQSAFLAEPSFMLAFEALTPGRQRGYLLHFAGAKQSKTRASRIEKHRQRIFQGKGLQDR